VRFTSVRFTTPHPIVDLREVGGNIRWRVRAETLEVERPHRCDLPSSDLLRDRTRSRCTACGQHAERKGGKNIRHRFVCAECARHQ
jgi:hypothetical protein